MAPAAIFLIVANLPISLAPRGSDAPKQFGVKHRANALPLLSAFKFEQVRRYSGIGKLAIPNAPSGLFGQIDRETDGAALWWRFLGSSARFERHGR